MKTRVAVLIAIVSTAVLVLAATQVIGSVRAEDTRSSEAVVYDELPEGLRPATPSPQPDAPAQQQDAPAEQPDAPTSQQDAPRPEPNAPNPQPDAQTSRRDASTPQPDAPRPSPPTTRSQPPQSTSANYRVNEPAGFRAIADYGFDDPPPDFGDGVYFEREPCGPFRCQYWAKPRGLWSLVPDPTAPFGPNVWREVYPPGLSGDGSTQFHLDVPGPGEVYISWVMKWDADFEWNGTSDKQIHFNLGSGGRPIIWQFHWGSEALLGVPTDNSCSPSSAYPTAVSPRRDGCFDAMPPRGQWVEYELYLNATTGELKWWLDGRLRAHHRGVDVPTVRLLTFDTTWGGGGNKRTTSYRYTDHIYVAVR